jgi:hypothetical protein
MGRGKSNTRKGYFSSLINLGNEHRIVAFWLVAFWLNLLFFLLLVPKSIIVSIVVNKKLNKKSIPKKFNKAISQTGVDTRKYCGVIKLFKDPLAIQKKIRNEWD